MRKLLLIIFSVLTYATTYSQNITTIAGGLGDGIPAIYDLLYNPTSTAVDAAGNIYISDGFRCRIRKVSISTGIISTVAGNGFSGFSGDSSLAISARISPRGIAIDGSGNIYIADGSNNRIRKVTASTGIISTIAGNGIPGYGGDGFTAKNAHLLSPTSIALDGSGNIYIADRNNHRIRKVTASTGIISTVAGNGTKGYGGDDSLAISANLNNPIGVAVDAAGNIYIADRDNNRIRKVTASTGIINTVAGNGTQSYAGDGSAAISANLNFPNGVTVDVAGNIYIADAGNNRIRKVTTLTGIISSIAGNGIGAYGGDGSVATSANLDSPKGVTVDSSGNIYIADDYNQRIRKITASTGIISTVAGNGTTAYVGDGNTATLVSLNHPRGVATDGSGNIYIADLGNRIRKVNAYTGIISTVAGNGTQGYGGDGSASTSANLNNPRGLAVDGLGNIYIADRDNHRIRKINALTGIISTVAGNGTDGYGGDGSVATSANLNYPEGVAVDVAGNIYIADASNNRIRKVTASTGIITTLAGNGIQGYNYLDDGGIASSARLNNPQGVAVDGLGNIYIADNGNDRIRKVTALTSIINTVAGVGPGIGGDGSAATSARIWSPYGVAVDGSGNIYIADYGNDRIRKVTASSGIISTVAGSERGYGGDGSSATSAKLNGPTGVALDGTGNIYIADANNLVIRKVIISIANNIISSSQTICAGSAPTILTGSTPISDTNSFTYSWLSSTTSATAGFSAIPSANTINYSPGVLTQNTWFRRYVVSGALTDTSAAVAITVNNAIANNNITGTAQTICSGSIPAPITATTATGGNGTTYTYKWLKSTTSATTGFANAGGNDSIQNFTPNAITQNTWFKRRVASGVCNADTTSAILVTVNTAIANNNITGTAQTICAGSIPAPIIATTATGGNDTTYNYKWIKSTTSATTGFANAGGNDSLQNFTSIALTQNTWFKRRVISGVCNADTTAAFLVTVNTAIANNTITGTAQTICSGSIPSPITATAATGGNGSTYTYKWLKSITSATAGFVNAGANDATQNFTSGALTQNTWFKRKVTSGVCNADTTSALLLTVNPIPLTSNITGLTNVARLDTASYSITGTSGSIFNWIVSGATVQSGAGSNKIQVKWSTIGTQQLKVTETSNKGCIGLQKSLSVNVSPTIGMDEISTSKNILVYPNPFNETIFISLLNNSGLNKAILFDLLGKEVLTTHKSEIDVKELKSGVYLMMVIDNNGNSYSQKLIKN